MVIVRKELGQHFLRDRKTLEREVGYAGVSDDEVVLEIGPGTGNLTQVLLKKARKVIAIEKDEQFKEKLESLWGNLEVIFGDAMNVKFPRFDKVVSNLPFKVALPLTFKLLEKNFKLGVVLYQERLAKRICAKCGEPKYGRLGVQIQRIADVTILETVSRDKFSPRPAVDCCLVLIEKKKNVDKVESDEYFKKTLDYLFFRRDKSLNYVLKELKVNENISNKKIYQLEPREFVEISNLLFRKKVRIPVISNELKRKAQKYASGGIRTPDLHLS